MKTVCVSMYADPLHSGHIECLEKARALGDRLVVIVNNDHQATLKKGRPFMKETERMRVIGALKVVDEVVLSIDRDRTVCETLRRVHPDIFANGGDVSNTQCPEARVCEELGIKMVDGLGDKIQSSSWLTGLVANS